MYTCFFSFLKIKKGKCAFCNRRSYGPSILSFLLKDTKQAVRALFWLCCMELLIILLWSLLWITVFCFQSCAHSSVMTTEETWAERCEPHSDFLFSYYLGMHGRMGSTSLSLQLIIQLKPQCDFWGFSFSIYKFGMKSRIFRQKSLFVYFLFTNW